MSLLGLDIGTTNCKGAVFSLAGHCLARASFEYPTLQQHAGWAELDSRAVMHAVFRIIRELAQTATVAGDAIRAVCVSALGEAVTPVSKDRQILGNAILHFDRRGKSEMDEFMEGISREAIYSINGNLASPAFSLAKILWTRKHRRELYDNADKLLLFGELFFYLAGCEAVTSYSQASRTLLFDFKKLCWSSQLLKLAGLEADRLARPVPSGHIAGTIADRIAADLELDRNVLCVVGAHDQCSNALGVGICSPGKAVDGIGTVECITPVYSTIPDEKLLMAAGLNVEPHAVSGLHVSFLYNQAGSLVKWHRNTFAEGERKQYGDASYAFLEKEMPREPTQLLVLPHFEPTGPPHFIENSSGIVLGLRTSTTRGEILKAILESETFYFLECIEMLRPLGIDMSRFVASGGGAKSSAWLQIKADIMGIPYERASDPEAGVLGAIIIASKAVVAFSNYEDACAHFVRHGRCFEPDPNRHATYQDQFERYRQIYPRLADLLQPSRTLRPDGQRTTPRL